MGSLTPRPQGLGQGVSPDETLGGTCRASAHVRKLCRLSLRMPPKVPNQNLIL